MRPLVALVLAASTAFAQKNGVDLNHGVTVTALAFSPNGRTLAAGGQDRTVRLWDLDGGTARELKGHDASITSLVYSRDGKRLASGSRDNTVILWDPVSDKPIRKLTGHERTVMSVAFSPDGRFLASSSYDRTVRIWDVGSGKTLCNVEAHDDAVSCIGWSSDGTLASGGHDALVKLWTVAPDGTSLKLRHSMRDSRRSEVTGLGFSMGGRLLASATPQGIIRLRDVVKGEELRTAVNEDVNVLTLACSIDGRMLGAAGIGGAFVLCETASGAPIARRSETPLETSWFAFTPTEGYAGEVRAIALSSTGLTAAVGTKNGKVLVRDVGRMLLGKNVPVKPTDRDLDRLWTELSDADPSVGYRAVGMILARPDATVPFLKKQLRPIEPPDAQRFSFLILQLDSKKFAEREKAATELEKHLDMAEGLLRKRLREQPPLELRRRIERLLHPLDERTLPADRLRAGRAMQSLEHLRRPDSVAVLEGLAKGCPGAWMTVEAKAALDRLRISAP